MGHNPYVQSAEQGEPLTNLRNDVGTFVSKSTDLVGFLTHNMRPAADTLTRIDNDKANALLHDLLVACNGLASALEAYPVVPSDPGDQIVS